MPLRIWMPSCAAGPEKTAAWPSRMRSWVTPCAAAAAGSAAARIRMRFFFMVLLLDGHREEIGVLCQLRQVELLPLPAVGIGVLRARPGRRIALDGLQLPGVAQPEGAVYEQRGTQPEALAYEQQARLLSGGYGGAAEKRRKIDHAIEIAADVGHPSEPRPRE